VAETIIWNAVRKNRRFLARSVALDSKTRADSYINTNRTIVNVDTFWGGGGEVILDYFVEFFFTFEHVSLLWLPQ
jgi:hypothetical protein